MKRPPLIAEPTINRVLKKIRSGGSEACLAFLASEPYLKTYLDTLTKEAMEKILNGRSKNQAEVKVITHAVKVAVLRSALFVRECYRDIAENLLAASLQEEQG